MAANKEKLKTFLTVLMQEVGRRRQQKQEEMTQSQPKKESRRHPGPDSRACRNKVKLCALPQGGDFSLGPIFVCFDS